MTDVIDIILAHPIKLGAASHWQWHCLGCNIREIIPVPDTEPRMSSEDMDVLQAYGGADHLAMMILEDGYMSTDDAMDIADQHYVSGYSTGYYDHKDGRKHRPEKSS